MNSLKVYLVVIFPKQIEILHEKNIYIATLG